MATIMSQPEEEEVHCFVCDNKVTGRYYSLATCRTQNSKTRIIEKLGALVGDQYMVVISEDDVICRSCATLMNTLDRLETEALAIRGNVLKFLEKKYQLSDGELVNQLNTGLSQPPRITPSEKPVQVQVEKSSTKSNTSQTNFMTRKRKAALAQMYGMGEQENVDVKKKLKGPWLQCNTCKYTTKYKTFLNHHMPDEVPVKIVAEPIVPATKVIKVVQTGKPLYPKKSSYKSGNRRARAISGDGNSRDSDNSETVEMIAAEISHYVVDNTGCDNLNDSGMNMKIEPDTIKVQIVSQGKSRKKYFGNNDKEVTIQLPSLPEDVGMGNMSLMSVDGDDGVELSIEEQMMKMNEGDENTVYVQMIEGDKTSNVASSAKQVMTVSADGTLEMVEVLWDEEEQDMVAEDGAEY